MKAGVEVYKGIEFVRLSSLSKEQATSIVASNLGGKTIKILRDNELLSDCLLYTVYLEWYHQSLAIESETREPAYPQGLNHLKLVLK